MTQGYTYLVPRDTERALKRFANDCMNMGLILTRYAPLQVIEPTDKLNDRGRSEGKYRNFWLPDICGRFTLNADRNWLELVAASVDRWGAQTTGALRFQLTALTRVIVGLGGKGALEFGITLHPVTGLPYIPGSALKGLCRNYALLLAAAELNLPIDSETLDKLENSLIESRESSEFAQLYCDIFGTQGAAGKCVFYDAIITDIPRDASLFTVDVMTPHFPKYYQTQGATPPSDSDNPIPVPFITVTAGVQFGFAVGARRGIIVEKALMRQARSWLKEALREMGIGAKTAAGYGVLGTEG